MDKNLRFLEDAGLSKYEAKVYHALLIQQNLTATEISKLSSVPRSKVYDVLENLINKGICTELIGKVRTFKAVDPEFAFSKLIKKVDEQKNAILTASTQLSELFQANSMEFNPLNFVEIVRDKERVNKYIYDLAEKANNEICNMTKPPYIQNIEDLQVVEDEGDVSLYYLYETRTLLADSFLEYLTAVEKQGANIRFLPELPLKMLIFDNKSMMLTIQDEMPDPHTFSTMVIKYPKLINFIREMFMVYFEKGITIDEYKKQIKEGQNEK